MRNWKYKDGIAALESRATFESRATHMKRLLMIAYDFPPLLAGVRRTVAFARYLPDSGWMAEVITVKPVRSWAYDPAPLADLTARGVAVHRAGSRDLDRVAWLLGRCCGVAMSRVPHMSDSSDGSDSSDRLRGAKTVAPASIAKPAMAWLRRHYFCPDDRAGWIGPATRLAESLIHQNPPDAIYTTSFPHSAHVVGLNLKRRFPALPWLADFRDGWTQNADFFAPLSERLKARSAELERRTALAADAITAVSDPITRHFRALRADPGAPDAEARVFTLPNGYDAEALTAAKPRTFDGFTLVYAGSLFGARKADPLLAAAAEAMRRDEALRRDLRLVFVGAFGPELREAAARYGLADRLTVTGPLAHREALGALKGASATLLLVPREPNAEIMLTQKVFECMAAGAPLLALAPEGACRDTVESIGGGVTVDPDSPAEAAQALIRIRNEREAGTWRGPEAEKLAQFERRALTARLAEILDDLSPAP